MLELEEEIDTYRCCKKKRGHLKLFRLETGADTATERRTGALQGSAAVTTKLGLDGCNW